MNKPITLVETDGVKKLCLSGELSSHLSTHAFLYLQPNGWFNDYPCDENGICPWYTFPAISYLKDIIKKEFKILEYGSGFSTLYFKQQVSHLVTVEHDQEWVDKLLEKDKNLDIHLVRANAGIHPEAKDLIDNFMRTFEQVKSENQDHDIFHGLSNFEYAGYASRIYQASKNFYDIVVIDGMARALCAVMAVESGRLKDKGIIILDNSDRWQYNPIQKYMYEKGYGRIDFWGPGWNNYQAWCTSFYSKAFPTNNNLLLRPETQGPIII